jgi:hypothetical protein
MPDEYISREAALKYIKLEQCRTCSDIGLCGNCAVLVAVKLLEKVPAADVAEVVRCKDCRHSKYAAWCEGYACCRTVGEYHHADFGCTDGKLRTNGVTE